MSERPKFVGGEVENSTLASFRPLLESMPDALVIVDPGGRMVQVNAQTEELFGYAREELLDQTVEMLMPGRYREHHHQHRDHYLVRPHTRPMGVGLNLFGLHKDGHEFPVEISLSSFEVDGELLVFAAIRDTTERMNILEALRLNAERLRVALEYSPTTVFNQDLQLRYTWVFNPPPGLDTDWFNGKTDAELFRRGAARLTDIKRRVLETGDAAHEEVSVIVNSQLRSYDLYIQPRHDAGGKIIGITGATTDITKQKHAEQALQRLNQELERLVSARTMELAAANAELRAASEERGRLYDALLQAQERERARISRDLHDSVGQALTGILLMLEDPSQARQLRKLVGQTLQEVRKISQDLRPSLLDELGLEAALRQYGREIAERGGLDVTVLVHQPHTLSKAQEIGLYRITQEALTNVLRHSGARQSSVVLTATETTLQLVVEDDGVGFDLAAIPAGHLGLSSMKERADLLGGACHIESKLGQGSSVHVRIPRTPLRE